MGKMVEIWLVAWIVLTALTLAFVTFNLRYPIKYKDEIIKLAALNNLPPSFVASVINCESGFNKDAKSNVGAIGLMQLLPATAEFIKNKYNLKLDVANLCDVKTNITLGCAYLNYLSSKFYDKFTLLCAYNAGEGNVIQWLANKKYSLDGEKLQTTPFPSTNHYAAKVIKDEKIYKKFFV